MKGQKRTLTPIDKLFTRNSRSKTFQESEETALEVHTTIFEQEAFHLTNNEYYFPELVWKLIAKKLNTPSDIENCYNSGYFFKKLLSKERERNIVLPKVFEILAEKYDKSMDNSYTETDPQSIPWNHPVDRPINGMTGIWKFKLVCKSWSKAIDKLFQQDDVGHRRHVVINRPIPFTPGFRNSHLLKYANCHFSMKTANDFIAHFKSTHYDICAARVTKNPFLGRHVEFYIMTSGTHDFIVKYQTDMSEILGKWGREIWYCRINRCCFGDEIDVVAFYRLFRQSLIWMPNLKYLNVVYNVVRNDFGGLDFGPLIRAIGENALPKLSNMMFLQTFNLPGPIIDHFISVNNVPERFIGSSN